MCYTKTKAKVNLGDDHITKLFTQLMIKGQVKSAVWWLMDWALGKVLNHSSVMNSNGKTVFDVLKEKHPDPSTVSENVFIHCNELPPQMEVDITVAMLNLLVENYQKV